MTFFRIYNVFRVDFALYGYEDTLKTFLSFSNIE